MAFNFLIPIGHALANDLLAPYLGETVSLVDEKE
jgi:hypothetical protein